MKLSFEDSRDSFYGNLETLTANRDQSIAALNLRSPSRASTRRGRAHPQAAAGGAGLRRARSRQGRLQGVVRARLRRPQLRAACQRHAGSIAAIGREDLEATAAACSPRTTFASSPWATSSASALGKLLDEAFDDLPDNADLFPVPATKPRGGGHKVVEMDVPQSVAIFGLAAMPRKHPDFMPAFVLNHILGGGGFASRLMEEVREKRAGLLGLQLPAADGPRFDPRRQRGDQERAIQQSLEVIRGELQRMASEGPSAEDLENAKRYLVGSYALRFDTSAKIAAQLLGIKEEGLGIDYVERRNALVEAVTLDDVKSVAARLLQPENLIVTIVGKPEGMAAPG